MASHGKGLICMPLSGEKCDQLNLPMMTNFNRASHGTGFTVSIEAASGFLQEFQPLIGLTLYLLRIK